MANNRAGIYSLLNDDEAAKLEAWRASAAALGGSNGGSSGSSGGYIPKVSSANYTMSSVPEGIESNDYLTREANEQARLRAQLAAAGAEPAPAESPGLLSGLSNVIDFSGSVTKAAGTGIFNEIGKALENVGLSNGLDEWTADPGSPQTLGDDNSDNISTWDNTIGRIQKAMNNEQDYGIGDFSQGFLAFHDDDGFVERLGKMVATFGLDTATDPLTYLTLGAGAAGKAVVMGGLKATAKAATKEMTEEAVTGLATKASTYKTLMSSLAENNLKTSKDLLRGAAKGDDELTTLVNDAAKLTNENEQLLAFADLAADRRIVSAFGSRQLTDDLAKTYYAKGGSRGIVADLNSQVEKGLITAADKDAILKNLSREAKGGLRINVPFKPSWSTKAPITGVGTENLFAKLGSVGDASRTAFDAVSDIKKLMNTTRVASAWRNKLSGAAGEALDSWVLSTVRAAGEEAGAGKLAKLAGKRAAKRQERSGQLYDPNASWSAYEATKRADSVFRATQANLGGRGHVALMAAVGSLSTDDLSKLDELFINGTVVDKASTDPIMKAYASLMASGEEEYNYAISQGLTMGYIKDYNPRVATNDYLQKVVDQRGGTLSSKGGPSNPVAAREQYRIVEDEIADKYRDMTIKEANIASMKEYGVEVFDTKAISAWSKHFNKMSSIVARHQMAQELLQAGVIRDARHAPRFIDEINKKLLRNLWAYSDDATRTARDIDAEMRRVPGQAGVGGTGLLDDPLDYSSANAVKEFLDALQKGDAVANTRLVNDFMEGNVLPLTNLFSRYEGMKSDVSEELYRLMEDVFAAADKGIPVDVRKANASAKAGKEILDAIGSEQALLTKRKSKFRTNKLQKLSDPDFDLTGYSKVRPEGNADVGKVVAFGDGDASGIDLYAQDFLKSFMDNYLASHNAPWIVKIVAPYMRFFKGSATIGGGLGYHIRNNQGGFYNNLLIGVAPSSYVKAWRLTVARNKAENYARKNYDKFNTPSDFEKAYYDKLRELLNKGGGRDVEQLINSERAMRSTGIYTTNQVSDFANQDFGAGVGLTLSKNKSVAKNMGEGKGFWGSGNVMNVSNNTENLSTGAKLVNSIMNNRVYKASAKLAMVSEELHRGAAFIHGMRRFGDDAEQAASLVKATQFDYEDLSEFERTYAKTLMPFYVWTRNNIPLQLRSLITNPRVPAGVMRLQELGSEAFGDNSEAGQFVRDNMNKYSAARLAFPVAAGGNQYLLGTDLPVTDLQQMFAASANPWDTISKAGKETFASSNPLVKAGFSFFTNTDPATGAQIEDPRGPETPNWMRPLPGNYDDEGTTRTNLDWLAKLGPALVPQLRQIDRLVPSIGPFQQRKSSADRIGTSWASTALGLPATSATSDQLAGTIAASNNSERVLLEGAIRGIVQQTTLDANQVGDLLSKDWTRAQIIQHYGKGS